MSAVLQDKISRPVPRLFRAASAILALCLLALSSAAPGQTATPAVAATAPVVLVIAPPVGPDALLTLGDLLAEKLGHNGSLRVVDRTQIEHLLAEKQLDAKSVQPVLSYDFLVRLRVDLLRAALVVEVIDLSTGNLRGSREFPWPAKPDDRTVAEMVKLCQTAAAQVVRGEKRQLRVRLLGVENPEHRVRLQPLAEQFAAMMEAMAGKSSRCQIVQHLEALTLKEESLFLYAGLSQLSGGREFLPQSDLTLEGEIRESDIVGKTFEETPLEISWRVTVRGQPRAEPTVLKGTVKDWPALVRQFGEKLAGQLGEASPVPFGDFAVEMANRRQQAEAELAAAIKELRAAWAGSLSTSLSVPDGGFKVHPGYARIAVSAKLDPTYEEAAFQLIRYGSFDDFREGTEDARAWVIKESLNYLSRFPGNVKHRKQVFVDGIFVAGSYFKIFQINPKLAPPLSQRSETLGVVKQILDLLPIGKGDWYERDLVCHEVNRLCEELNARHVPQAERDLWLADYVERYEKKLGRDEIEMKNLQLGLALADHDNAAARALAEAILARHPQQANPERQLTIWEGVHQQFMGLNNPELLARLKPWIEVQIAQMKNQKYAKYASDWLKSAYREPLPPPPPPTEDQRKLMAEHIANMQKQNYSEIIEYLDIHDQSLRRASPQLVHNRVLYMNQWVGGDPPKDKLLRVSLDAAGRSTGKPEPLPNTPKGSLSIFSAVGSRVYFGAAHDGLREFDESTGRWRSWSAAQGLPAAAISGLFALDEKTLLLVGRGGDMEGFLFTLNVESGAVKVLVKDMYWPNLPWLDCFWRNGDKYLSVMGDGRLLDGLTGGVVGRLAVKLPYWDPFNNKIATAVVGTRRWIGLDGLYEINDQGKVIRSYFGEPARPPAVNVIPPFGFETDRRFLKLTHDDTHLYLVAEDKIVCYDPAADMWYGPLTRAYGLDNIVPASRGIWAGTNLGPGFIDTAKFIAAAEAGGLRGSLTKSVQEFRETVCPGVV